MIAERTRDKIAAARRRGKWTGGLLPLGYRLEEGKLVIEEDEALIVRKIFSLYLETRSLVHVVEQLRDRGRKTKAYVSKNGNVRSAKAWTKQSVLRVLRKPVMAGQIHSNGAFFPGEHEGIISSEDFNRVKAMLDGKPALRMPTVRNPAYVLRGVLKCGRCGAPQLPARAIEDLVVGYIKRFASTRPSNASASRSSSSRYSRPRCWRSTTLARKPSG